MKYSVFGGQSHHRWYGDFDNLLVAKRVATKNEEYWGGWQGWHKPSIWLASDCGEDGYPIPGRIPFCVWEGKKWVLTEYGEAVQNGNFNKRR